VHHRAFALLLAGAIAAAGCKAAVGDLTARASDEWTRTYPLTPTGEVQIVNSNGRIAVEGVDGSMVDVTAERIARGATEALARQVLPRITIKETIRPDFVSIETERVPGVMIGASYSVEYRVKVPRGSLLRARSGNGSIDVGSVTGRVVLNSANGSIIGRDLGGGVDARAINGQVQIEVRAIGDDPIDLRTTNGSIRLTLPPDAKGNLSARAINGTIDTGNLPLDLIGEQSSREGDGRFLRGDGGRRVRGRLNGGGTPIELNTINGRIEVTGRQGP